MGFPIGQGHALRGGGDIDFGHEICGLACHRPNFFMQKKGIGARSNDERASPAGIQYDPSLRFSGFSLDSGARHMEAFETDDATFSDRLQHDLSTRVCARPATGLENGRGAALVSSSDQGGRMRWSGSARGFSAGRSRTHDWEREVHSHRLRYLIESQRAPCARKLVTRNDACGEEVVADNARTPECEGWEQGRSPGRTASRIEGFLPG